MLAIFACAPLRPAYADAVAHTRAVSMGGDVFVGVRSWGLGFDRHARRSKIEAGAYAEFIPERSAKV